jgi:hypothetical protein
MAEQSKAKINALDSWLSNITAKPKEKGALKSSLSSTSTGPIPPKSKGIVDEPNVDLEKTPEFVPPQAVPEEREESVPHPPRVESSKADHPSSAKNLKKKKKSEKPKQVDLVEEDEEEEEPPKKKKKVEKEKEKKKVDEVPKKKVEKEAKEEKPVKKKKKVEKEAKEEKPRKKRSVASKVTLERLREIQRKIAEIAHDISTKKLNAMKLAVHEFLLVLLTLPDGKIAELGKFYGGLYSVPIDWAKLMNKGESPLKDDEDFIDDDSSDAEADGGPDAQDEDPEVSSQELDDESEDIAEDEE